MDLITDLHSNKRNWTKKLIREDIPTIFCEVSHWICDVTGGNRVARPWHGAGFEDESYGNNL